MRHAGVVELGLASASVILGYYSMLLATKGRLSRAFFFIDDETVLNTPWRLSHFENFDKNMSFRRLFQANRKITEATIIGDDTCYTVMKIAKLHGKLNDIIDETNACYSIQVSLFDYLFNGQLKHRGN